MENFMKRICRVSFVILLISLSCCRVHDTYFSNDEFFTLHYDGDEENKHIAVILPGQHQKVSQHEYRTIGNYFLENGIRLCYVDVSWENIHLNNIVDVCNRIGTDVATQNPHARIVVFGFSFGAVMAVKMTEQLNPAMLLLCSLSPVFKEDVDVHPFYLKPIFSILSDYTTNQLFYPPELPDNTIFLYGDHDTFVLSEKIIASRKFFYPRSRTVIVQGAEHDISGETYLETVKKYIDEMRRAEET